MNTEAGANDSSPPKILVVDDLYANRMAMRRALSTLPIELVEAGSGNDALMACVEQEFALILLDVQMPVMDGMEVAQLLHDEESTRDTPIIFVTAGAGDDIDRRKGYDVGAVDYITKPLKPSLLAAKVRNFIELYESRRALRQAMAALDERNTQLEREIEERRRAEDRAQHLATHDALTGLPNRLLFLDRLSASVQRARRHQSLFALGYMDLDGFKPINDQYGHGIGDVTLQTIAERLAENVRQCDTVARFGGDEFALIFKEITDAASCQVLCEKLRQLLSAPINLPCVAGSDAMAIHVGVSIGLALYPQHGVNVDQLMHNADQALYTVKKSGKARVHIFSTDDDASTAGTQMRKIGRQS